MTNYLERARIARAVKVRVMDQWGIAGHVNRSILTIRSTGRHPSKTGFDGATAEERSPDPGLQFPGNRLKPAT